MDPVFQQLREENDNLTKALAFLEKQLEMTLSNLFQSYSFIILVEKD
jgi:hypothetical protein